MLGTQCDVKDTLNYHEKLDTLLEGLAQVAADIEELKETQAEIIEKLANLNLPYGDGFNTFDS